MSETKTKTYKSLKRPVEVVTVSYRASWDIVTQHGFSDEVETVQCSHNHRTPASAEVCARDHGAR